MNDPKPFRVLIVDDSAFMRKALRMALETEPGVEIVGNARNGEQAIDLASKLSPDLVTMDVEMPGMDGLVALRRIMRECPTKVVMVSSLTTEGSQAALTAMKLGAIHAIAKHNGGDSAGATDTGNDLRDLVRGLRDEAGKSSAPAPRPPATHQPTSFQVQAICIGSSTGGPPVLEQLIAALKGPEGPPIIIAQHMPEVFTRSMAGRFNELSERTVVHLEDHNPIEPNTIYICPGSQNTHFVKDSTGVHVRINREPSETIYFPSVNVLLETAGRVWGAEALGVVLTGMGEDGAEGAAKLAATGARIVAQDAASCTIYGMPRAVVERGLAEPHSPQVIADMLNAARLPRRVAA